MQKISTEALKKLQLLFSIISIVEFASHSREKSHEFGSTWSYNASFCFAQRKNVKNNIFQWCSCDFQKTGKKKSGFFLSVSKNQKKKKPVFSKFFKKPEKKKNPVFLNCFKKPEKKKIPVFWKQVTVVNTKLFNVYAPFSVLPNYGRYHKTQMTS